MKNLFTIFCRYILPHWPVMLVTVAFAIVVMALNIVMLGLFSGIPQLILRQGDPSSLLPGAAAMGSGSGLSLQEILNVVSNLTEGIRLEHGIVAAILTISSLYLLTVAILRVVQFLSDYVLLRANSKSVRRATTDMFKFVVLLSLDFFHGQRIGDLCSRIIFDTHAVVRTMFTAVMALLVTLPLLVFYWYLLVTTSMRLTFVVIVVFIIKTALSQSLAQYMRKLLISAGQLKGETAARVTETLYNITVVKAFGKETQEQEQFSNLIESQVETDKRRQLLTQLNSSLQTLLNSVAVVSVATYGTMLLIDGQIPLVTLMVYFFAANRAQEPTRQLTSFALELSNALGYSVRVFELLGYKSTVKDGPDELPGYAGDIEFRNVSFCYSNQQSILDGVSFTLKKGDVLAIVGPSGAGKSTLLHLLMRFYDPTAGAILIDGKDIRSFTQDSYRSLFGIVTQDPLLFDASIRDNIAYAANRDDVSEEEILRAAHIARVDEFAYQLEEGLNAQIGDRGLRLSGGQKQRIALARAILRDPPVLVLDEATSSLDSHSERLIQRSINTFLHGRTAVVVAHRLSTVRRATKIAVLEHGRIVELGGHDELLARQGAFYRLYQAQFAHGEPAVEPT
ncbi:MAG: ABC transporter ATP-binding protein [Rhodospirillales bacterium]|nr:ABC transporter ATP-binding protein [Rhodospirillales bacterium]